MVVVVVVRTECMTCVSLHACQRACNKLKWTSASALVPSAGLTSRDNATPVPSEDRFQASRVQNLTQPQVEEKDCEALPPHHPHSLGGGRRGCNLIHLLSVGCPGSGMTRENTTGRVFLVGRNLLTTLLRSSGT